MFGNDLVEEFHFKGKDVNIIYGDITQVSADVIVSSDDNHISMGGGVSQAIHEAAGDVVWKESRKYVPAQLGTTVITSAGNLSAKYIFHAIVIDYDQLKWPDVDTLRTATIDCLNQADKLSCQSLALPAFGTGAGGLASESAAMAVINAIFENLENLIKLQRVSLVLNRRDTLFDFVKSAIEARIRAEYEPKLEILKAEKAKLIAELHTQSPYRTLPYPIAIVRHLTESYGNYHSKFTSAIECAESILKYCAAVVLAESIQLDPKARETIHRAYETSATFSSSQRQLEAALEYVKGNSKFSAITRIKSAYFSKNKGYFSEIIEERNKNTGHGATLVDDAYKPMYAKLIRKVDSILSDFAFLGNYPLIVIEQTDITSTGFVYDLTRIMGDNVIFPKESISVVNLRMSKHTLYLFDPETEQALCLHPFLVFETCPHCQIQETFFLQKNSEKEATYHTYRANHRIQSSNYLNILKPPTIS